MEVLLYVPIALVTLATLCYYYVTRTFNYWKNKGVVGPEPVALFGNLRDSALRRKNIGVVFREIYEEFPNEKVVGIYRMTTPCLLVRDLDIIKHIMIKDFEVFENRGVEFSKDGLGENLFHADGETWRVLRNRFTPIFTSGKLKKMMYLIDERGDSFVKYTNELCKNNPVQEMYQLIQKYTQATIIACAFGLDIDTYHDTKTMEVFKKIDYLLFTTNFSLELDMMFPGILKKFNASLFPRFITDYFKNFVIDVQKQRNGAPSNRHDFMDLILELKNKGRVEGNKRHVNEHRNILELTDDIIAAQAFVFYAAGYETSASTMSYMLYELAKNPEIQDKLIAHVDSVLDKHNGQVTYDTVQDLNYMEYVFSETLRIHPIASPLQRNAKVEYKVPSTNLTIKKGTTVLVCINGIHHDEKYYPDPEKFIPERHTPENTAARHTCAYMPFGVGPRNCIGMRFAQVQSRICMLKFFSNFRVEFCEETPAEIGITPNKILLGPEGGVTLRIIKRNK